MMERKDFHLGPGAASLILVAVVISMAVLGLLAVLNVRNDAGLTDRSTTLIAGQYEASATAESDLARLDAAVTLARQGAEDDDTFLGQLADALPENMTLDGDIVSWDVTADGAALHCEVRVSNTAAADRLTWIAHTFESSVGDVELDME